MLFLMPFGPLISLEECVSCSHSQHPVRISVRNVLQVRNCGRRYLYPCVLLAWLIGLGGGRVLSTNTSLLTSPAWDMGAAIFNYGPPQINTYLDSSTASRSDGQQRTWWLLCFQAILMLYSSIKVKHKTKLCAVKHNCSPNLRGIVLWHSDHW